MAENCVFCKDVAGKRYILETDRFAILESFYPVMKGHLLIIPKRHVETIFNLNSSDWSDLGFAVHTAKMYLDAEQHPDGYNVGVNCGEAAGQSIFHAHIHVFPRRKGDVANPRGGIRNFMAPLEKLPEKY